MRCLLRLAVFCFQLTVALTAVVAPASAEALLFHGAKSGHLTYDQDEGGGNPFASAFIELLGKPSVRIGEFSAALRELTFKKSGGRQTADVPSDAVLPGWALVPQAAGEKRVALVLVVSDYSKMGPRDSLPGAKHDAQRVASALSAAGFVTHMALDLDLRKMRQRLAVFAAQSSRYDVALI